VLFRSNAVTYLFLGTVANNHERMPYITVLEVLNTETRTSSFTVQGVPLKIELHETGAVLNQLEAMGFRLVNAFSGTSSTKHLVVKYILFSEKPAEATEAYEKDALEAEKRRHAKEESADRKRQEAELLKKQWRRDHAYVFLAVSVYSTLPSDLAKKYHRELFDLYSNWKKECVKGGVSASDVVVPASSDEASVIRAMEANLEEIEDESNPNHVFESKYRMTKDEILQMAKLCIRHTVEEFIAYPEDKPKEYFISYKRKHMEQNLNVDPSWLQTTAPAPTSSPTAKTPVIGSKAAAKPGK